MADRNFAQWFGRDGLPTDRHGQFAVQVPRADCRRELVRPGVMGGLAQRVRAKRGPMAGSGVTRRYVGK